MIAELAPDHRGGRRGTEIAGAPACYVAGGGTCATPGCIHRGPRGSRPETWGGDSPAPVSGLRQGDPPAPRTGAWGGGRLLFPYRGEGDGDGAEI